MMKLLAPLVTCLLPWLATAQELTVTPVDYWNVALECKGIQNAPRSLVAKTTVTQPQGFARVFESVVEVETGVAKWHIVYPLVDDGRFDVEPATWSGYWIMGDYRFECELRDDEKSVCQAVAKWDPMSLCQRDNYGPIFSTYPLQFIECSPIRPAVIDEDQMCFTIRTMPDRVSTCSVVVDVTAPHDDRILAGPWSLSVGSDIHRQDFNTAGWPRGEYWIRVRVLHEGKPVGATLVRKVWKEILPQRKAPQDPRRIGGEFQSLASSSSAKVARNIRFVSDELIKQPDGPLIVMDKPWETELLYCKSLHFDSQRQEYVLEYELAGGDKQRAAERSNLPSVFCRAISKDGLNWTKPTLRLLEYDGTKENNLVPADSTFDASQFRSAAARLAHDYEKARFRRYVPQRDGPVNTECVFVSAVKGSFVEQCTDPSGHPYRVGAWPMEKRGDEYLVLTSEPILYSGVGMDLFHSTEKIALHVEDRSTGTLYYFFRPGAPSYPPHDASYDNMHMTRRCLGVLWTKDGVNWERRLIAVPDEQDSPGTQFYYNTLYTPDHEMASARPAMVLEDHWNKAVVSDAATSLGAFTIFDAKANRLWPELVIVEGMLHWRRFDYRRKLIQNGPPGSFDHGLIKIEQRYHQFGDQWWFPYQAINTLHQDYIGLAKFDNLDQFKKEFPNYTDVPGFVDWNHYWKRCKSMRYYTGIARCRDGRLAHVEPVDASGSVETLPFVVEGKSLRVNAAVPPDGSLTVEVLDKFGKVIPRFDASSCTPVHGDSTGIEVEWEQGRISDLFNQTVSLRLHLERAKVYGYRLQ